MHKSGKFIKSLWISSIRQLINLKLNFFILRILKTKQIIGESLTPRSDQDITSPYNIKHTTDENEKKKTTQRIISWPNTKFSKPTLWDFYGRQQG